MAATQGGRPEEVVARAGESLVGGGQDGRGGGAGVAVRRWEEVRPEVRVLRGQRSHIGRTSGSVGSKRNSPTRHAGAETVCKYLSRGYTS